MGKGLIEILRDFATTPRIATIAGSANMPLMKSFSGQDFDPIDRVTAEVTSALSKTTAGKIQIAQDLLQSGLIKTPQEYLTVVTTGKLEPLIEGEMAEILLVRSENEDLRSGIPCQALIIDEHAFHIAEHRSLLASTSARRDAQLVGMTLQHIQQHEQLEQQLQAQQPELLAATKQPPLPYPPPPPQPAPAPQPAAMPASRLPPGAAQLQQQPGPGGGPAPAKMPNLPAGAPPAVQEANAQFVGNNRAA